MDVDAFLREQDRRMNLPDDDFDEYLNRMGTHRRSRELTTLNNPAITMHVNSPSRESQDHANKEVPHVVQVATGRNNPQDQLASSSTVQHHLEPDATATNQDDHSSHVHQEDSHDGPNVDQTSSPISLSSPLPKKRKTSSSSSVAQRKRSKPETFLPNPVSEDITSLIADSSSGRGVTIPDSVPVLPRNAKRKTPQNDNPETPIQKKRPGPPKSLRQNPSSPLEEITSFSSCPKTKKRTAEPRPVPKEKPVSKMTKPAPKTVSRRMISTLKLDLIAPTDNAAKLPEPPTSPIEEPSLTGLKTPITTAPLHIGSSKLYLDVKERVARHSTSKKRDKVMKLQTKPTHAVIEEEDSIIYVSSSSSSCASSPLPIAAKLPKQTSMKAPPKAEKPKAKSSKGKKKEKPAPLTPTEYVLKLRAKIAAGPEKGADKKVSHRFLEGMNIFYTGGDMQYASERTRGRMNIIVRAGGNLLPKYDPFLVTHIITDAQERATLRALGINKLSEIPNHIPTVVWGWVVSGIGKTPVLEKGVLKVRMDDLWSHTAFGERIEAGLNLEPSAKGKAKAVDDEELSRISEFTQDKPRLRSARSTCFPYDIHDSEDEEARGGNSSTSAPPSPPKPPETHCKPVASSSMLTVDWGKTERADDPLAEFYAKARAEHDIGWSRQGEVEESDYAPSSDAEIEEPAPVIVPKKRGWTCDTKEVPIQNCANQDIIDKLQELKDLHQAKPSEDDRWRVFSYTKCIRALRNHPKRIESFSEARAIRGVGEKTAAKIMEILETGALRRIGYERTEDIKATRLFQGIYGVGQSTAYQWYAIGCRTLDDVVGGKCGVKLTPAQEIGVRFYDDINDRMPREEAKEIFDLIKPIALKIDPKLFVEIMGSYRRGKADCGDIDIMITRRPDDGKTHKGVLSRLLKDLHAAGIITEDLALPEDPDDLEAIYRGLCRVPKEGSRRRRIDFLTVPWRSRGAALLYYTGDDIFNRAIRMKANVLGYSLNQKGLFGGVVRDPRDRRIKLHEGTLVASETEEDIFKILNVPWQEPHERVRG